jgi:hypothetical protein
MKLMLHYERPINNFYPNKDIIFDSNFDDCFKPQTDWYDTGKQDWVVYWEDGVHCNVIGYNVVNACIKNMHLLPILPYNIKNYNGCVGKRLRGIRKYQFLRMCRLVGYRDKVVFNVKKHYDKIINLFRMKQIDVLTSYVTRAMVPLFDNCYILLLIIQWCCDDPLIASSKDRCISIINRVIKIHGNKNID